jgi:hypothetical protein
VRINVTDCPLLKSGVGGRFNKKWELYRVIGTDGTGSALSDNVVSFKFLPNGAYECELVPNVDHGTVQVRSPRSIGGAIGAAVGGVTNQAANRPTQLQGDPMAPVTMSEHIALTNRVEALERWIKAFTNSGEVPQ